VQLNQGNVEIAKEAMISPAFATKKKSLKIDENNITFKTINKNLDDYKQVIGDYEAEKSHQKDILTGMDTWVKERLKSKDTYYKIIYHSDNGVTSNTSGGSRQQAAAEQYAF
jgi:hypothetical protein